MSDSLLLGALCRSAKLLGQCAGVESLGLGLGGVREPCGLGFRALGLGFRDLGFGFGFRV